MKSFKSIKEIQKYYNPEKDAYEFVESGKKLDVYFNIDDLNIDASILANSILAYNLHTPYKIICKRLEAKNVKAFSIYAYYIHTKNIDAYDINVYKIDNQRTIKANNVVTYQLLTGDIYANSVLFAKTIQTVDDIHARYLDALSICAKNIYTCEINAGEIKYNAICMAYNSFIVNNIHNKRKNSKYFCLDSDIKFTPYIAVGTKSKHFCTNSEVICKPLP